MANTRAATTETDTISSSWGTRRGMMIMATATARPSRRYLITRVTTSVADKSICFYLTGGDFSKDRGLVVGKGFKLIPVSLNYNVRRA
jgi:hypothetical protein